MIKSHEGLVEVKGDIESLWTDLVLAAKRLHELTTEHYGNDIADCMVAILIEEMPKAE